MKNFNSQLNSLISSIPATEDELINELISYKDYEIKSFRDESYFMLTIKDILCEYLLDISCTLKYSLKMDIIDSWQIASYIGNMGPII